MLALGLLGPTFATGCGRGEPTAAAPQPFAEIRYQDVVVDQALYGTFDPATGVHTCADESRDSFVLAGGESRVYTLAVEGAVELELGGCAEGTPGPGDGLRLRIQLPDGRVQEEAVALGGGAGWVERRIALAAPDPAGREKAGGKVRFELSAERAQGGRVFVDTFALRSERPAAPAPVARRVLLLSLDAFREDAIGALGGGARTPVLDRLLAGSERFTPHWAQEISTKTSHASILTGLPVAVHGVDREERPLAAEIATLAERLAGTGASTGAFLQIAPFFAEKFALNQGFATYRLKAWTVEQELRLAADWASAHREKASFLFVHLYGAHSDFGILPYEAEGVTRADVAERFGVAGYGCRGESCASRMLLGINYGAVPRIDREAEIVRWLYDRGVETLDRQLGTFFDDLSRAGLWDETLVIVTGDHGESFDEHGYFLHTTPHEETLRVPLLVKWPGESPRAGVTTERFTTALDLAPTILAHFGLPAGDLPGHDLAQAAARAGRLMISKDAVRLDDLKLVFATPEFPRALYDLAADPGERTNLLPAREADAARLAEVHRLALAAAARKAAIPGQTDAEAQPFTPEEVERLRSLGYL
jgi:hypothetical protein